LVNATNKQDRGPIVRVTEKAAFEARLRLIPILPSIGSETVRKHLMKLNPLRRELANAAHCLVDADGLGLTGDSDKIKLACGKKLHRKSSC